MKIRVGGRYGTEDVTTTAFAIHESGALALLNDEETVWRVYAAHRWTELEVLEQ